MPNPKTKRSITIVKCPFTDCNAAIPIEYSVGHNDPGAEIVAQDKLSRAHSNGEHAKMLVGTT